MEANNYDFDFSNAPAFTDDFVPTIPVGHENQEKEVLNFGDRYVISTLPFTAVFKCSDIELDPFNPGTVVYDIVGPEAATYLKSIKISQSSFIEHCKTAMNAGVALVHDDLKPEEIDRFFETSGGVVNVIGQGTKKKFSKTSDPFVNKIVATHKSMQLAYQPFIDALGFKFSKVSFLRFPTAQKQLYDFNNFVKRVCVYQPDNIKGVLIPRFNYYKMPTGASVPKCAVVGDVITLLGWYTQAQFKDVIKPWYSKFPGLCLKKLFLPISKTLVDHSAKVCTELLLTSDTHVFSERWSRIIGGMSSACEPYPADRCLAILADHLKCTIFDGPLRNITKWCFCDKLTLVNYDYSHQDGVVVECFRQQHDVMDKAIVYNPDPMKVKLYALQNFIPRALVFIWVQIGKMNPSTYSTFFNMVRSFYLYIILAEVPLIAFVPSDAIDAFPVSALSKLWLTVNNYVLACFYKQWFAERPYHIFRLSMVGNNKVTLTVIPEPSPIVRM